VSTHFMVVLLLGQHTQQSICVLMCMQQFTGYCWTIQAQECVNGTMLCNVKMEEDTKVLVAADDCGHAAGMSCKHNVS